MLKADTLICGLGPMEFQSIFWMLAALSAGAVVKGATGMGLPMVALPVLTAVFGLQHAVGLMTIPLILTNAWQVWKFRAHAGSPQMSFMPWFLVCGMAGVGIGTWALTSLPERVLILGLGVVLLSYVCLRLLTPRWSLGTRMAERLGPIMGLAGGTMQGATGLSAPVGVTFIHSMNLERAAHIYAVSLMFLTFSLAQAPALWLAGVMQPLWMVQGLTALIPILIFMPLGQWASSKLSREAFDRMILIFLGAMGLKMVLGL
jgi:uncharacterized membrane protein YfcA